MRFLGVALLVSLLPLTANAQMGKMEHGKTGVQTMDCAAMIKNKAPLHDKLSELMTQIGDTLDAHAKWLSTNRDKASKAEVKEFTRLATQYHGISKSLKKLSTDMEKSSFPAAPHEMDKMDPRLTDMMSGQARLEREVAEMLKKDAASIEKNVAAIQQPKKASR